MINTLFSGLTIGALVALIGAVGLLNTPSVNAAPNCDKADLDLNKEGNQRGNTHCVEDDEPIPECKARQSNPQEDFCTFRGKN